MKRFSPPTLCLCALVAAFATSGCAIKKIAINKLGDALASGGTSFSSEDDPDLVKDAAPFSLKLMESLLAESPRHRGLLFATSSGFTQYAYAFVQQEADEVEGNDLTAAKALRDRAGRLYLRARKYGLRGLEAKNRGFEDALRANPKRAVLVCKAADVPLMYWTAVSWAAAISVSKDNPDLIADLSMIEALLDRALELDEPFDRGALHSFLVTYEMSRSGGTGDPAARSKEHFDRAVALCGGQQAGPFVTFAEAVSVQKQNRAEVEALLHQALAIDPNAKPEWRLVNLIMQRRARWLLARADELFLKREP
jgi:predicted anti-sigma-YlaC factor YlaD